MEYLGSFLKKIYGKVLEIYRKREDRKFLEERNNRKTYKLSGKGMKCLEEKKVHTEQ